LQETLERGAARTTIQPDSDLLTSIWVCGREKPEIELRSLVGLVGDWEQTGVRLANVEVDIRDGTSSTIDSELCCSSATESLALGRALTLSTGSCDDGLGLVHSVLALDMLNIARRKLRLGKIKLLANRLSRVACSNAGREAANDQKGGDELHVGCY
jgi:hypothetical protein